MPLTPIQLQRLALIHDAKGNVFCDRFAAELLTKKSVADLAASGKIPLAENKREKVFGYVVSVLADAGAVFVPTGTFSKAANDLASFFINLKRKKRHALFSKIQANPVHFTLVTLAFINALLITYGDQLWTKLPVNKEDTVAEQAEKLAKTVVGLIKDKRVPQSHWGDKSLVALVRGFYQLFQQGVLPSTYKKENMTEFTENSFLFEDVLLVTSAQLIGLPLNHFEKTQEWESQLDELEKKVDELKQGTSQEDNKEKALIKFGQGVTFGRGAQFIAEKIGTQQQIHGSAQQLAEAKKFGLDLGTFWGTEAADKTAEKAAEGEEKEILQTLIYFGAKASFGEDVKVIATKAEVQKRLVLT